MMEINFRLPLLLVVIFIVTATRGVAAETATDFIPEKTLFAIEVRDPRVFLNAGLDRLEQTVERIGDRGNLHWRDWRKSILLALQTRFGGERVKKIADMATVLGFATDRPAVLGLLPIIDGVATGQNWATSLFVVLPIRNRQRVEELLSAQGVLKKLYLAEPQRCARLRALLQNNWRFQKFPNIPGGDKLIGKEAILELPALSPYHCPAGGHYSLDVGTDKIVCSAHAKNVKRESWENRFARGLPETSLGEMTMVGNQTVGVAYGINQDFLVIAQDARVVKAALAAAAGKRPRFTLTPGTGEFLVRGGLQMTVLGDLLRQLHERSSRSEFGERSSLTRLFTFLQEHPVLHFQLTAQGNTGLVLTAAASMKGVTLYKKWGEIPPAKPGLGLLLPETSPLLVSTDILPEILEVITLALAANGNDNAAFAEWLPLLASRVFAWSLSDAKATGLLKVPNMVFLISRKGEVPGRAMRLLPKTLGSIEHLRPLPSRTTPGGVPYEVLAKLFRPGKGYRPPRPALYYGGPESYLALTTAEEDIIRIADTATKGLRGNPEYVALGTGRGGANLTAFLDLEKVIELVRDARIAYRQRLHAEVNRRLVPVPQLGKKERGFIQSIGRLRLDIWLQDHTLRLRLAQKTSAGSPLDMLN